MSRSLGRFIRSTFHYATIRRHGNDGEPVGPPGLLRPTGGRRRWVVWLSALALVAAVGPGWIGRDIRSPDELARRAQAPPPSRITAEVERRQLSTSVVIRGDVRFDQATEVTVDGDIGDRSAGALVVTGRIPRPGTRLAEGAVVVEVSGRPIFVLQGALPMYRPLRPGATGTDVRQLELALGRLGLFPHRPDDIYDGRTADAVAELFRNAGYEPVERSSEERQLMGAAETHLLAARSGMREAEARLAEARRPPSRSQILAAEGGVDEARRSIEVAIARRAEAVAAGAPASELAALDGEIAAARNRLAVAESELVELISPADTRAQTRAVQDARAEVDAASSALTALSRTLGARVPRGEVIFAPSLPRVVDKVHVGLGDQPQGPVVSLAATRVMIDAAVSKEERSLLKVGSPARLDDQASAVAFAGKVFAIAETPGTEGAPPGAYRVRIAPEDADLGDLSGLNVRVTLPVRSTADDVLVVPVAALATNAAGAVSVQVEAGDALEEVLVGVGLAADGFVEVEPLRGGLSQGDFVVVGHRR
ncbi:HlyD family efflux transporter periplasmic adaptor subunit [Salinispora arenicola]|uniref:Peptidoglycan-binding domain 1 protein n=1 Tax=Salinispora arenicola TaxID=168697 RepID=A0A542XIG4_SALAC|nr:HlyD family efflux transporter periplasmic adaptor subunit [Salinispora arenicola]TQL35641.1 hypothetical protein FB564_0704 [Salinispora arenicola]GIM81754.1 hypothetical protein Sar04_03780 [Salinispora arenicola]